MKPQTNYTDMSEIENQPLTVECIRTKIYELRGQRVMLDKDLASLYQVETKRLKEAVKRNIARFPLDAMFVVTEEEFDCLRSQFATSNKRGGTRYLPFVFTELGVAMLSSVLNSEIAIQVNINIMRAFILLRKQNTDVVVAKNMQVNQMAQKLDSIKDYIEEVLHDQNDINEDTSMQLELINQTLAELQVEKNKKNERKPIGFKI